MATNQHDEQTPFVKKLRRKLVPSTQPPVVASSGETSMIVPRGWPTSPNVIQPASLWSIISTRLTDVLLFLFSTAFLTFALLVNRFDQAETKDHPSATRGLLSASKYGPTVFPILFAAVFGRATHAILTWRLHRVGGERLGVLDTLASSTSFTSTVKSQLRLRMISTLGVFLVAIWALSPIGSQASFRLIRMDTKTTTWPAAFDYKQSSGDISFLGDSFRGYTISRMNAAYSASIIAPSRTKASARDTWGNVRIPMIEPYENISKQDTKGWFIAVNTSSNTYASLVGVPIAGVNSSSFIDYNFTIQTTYLHLDCPFYSNTVPSPYPDSNYSVSGTGSRILWYSNSMMRSETEINKLKPINFTYFTVTGTSGVLLQCMITTTYVEVEIFCPDQTSCAVSRLRRSLIDHPPSAFTTLDLLSYSKPNWEDFMTYFYSTLQGRQATLTLMDEFIVGVPADQAVTSPGGVSAVRLAQVFNTYWTCMQTTSSLTGWVPGHDVVDSNFSYPAFPTDSTPAGSKVGIPKILQMPWRSHGSKNTRASILSANKGWVAALCIASIVLIFASFIPPLVRYLIPGPELAINVSSLATRNNPYIPLPAPASFLNAEDRARLLRDIKVQFGDVEAEADTGMMAIGSAFSGTYPLSRARKGRYYQ